MKTGRRIVLLLALVALVHAPIRAEEEQDASSQVASSQVMFIASIASPLEFVTNLDGFVSTVADGLDDAEEFAPGALATKILMELPFPLRTVEMEEPVFFILPMEEISKEVCVVVSVPDFDNFIKGLDLYSSVTVENAEDPDSPRSVHMRGFGPCHIVKLDDRTVLLGSDDDALRWLRGIIGDLPIEHPEGYTASISFHRPIRFDKRGLVRYGLENIVREIDDARPKMADLAAKIGLNAEMLSGFADLLQIVARGAVGEIATLEDVKLSVAFDREYFDATLALVPDGENMTELMRSAVGFLIHAEQYEPKLAAKVPADAVGLGRFIMMVQDPDYAEKLVEWVGLVADKIAPAKKEEMLALFADRHNAGNPGEMAQYFLSRDGRDLSIAYVEAEDARAFIRTYDGALKLLAGMVNSFMGEAPGRGLRAGLSKLPGEDADSYSLDFAVGLGSKLADGYYMIPRDSRTEIDDFLANLGLLIGRVDETVVIVSGAVQPEDLAYAKGFLESSPDDPFLGRPGPAATLHRLPSRESGFYSLIDMRGLADMIVANIGKEGAALGVDLHELDRLSKALVGGGDFAGFSMSADPFALSISASAPTKGVNEAVKNFTKLFQFIRDGRFEEDD